MPHHPNQTSYVKGHKRPRQAVGRRKMTDEEKRQARIRRAAEFDYKLECRALLPLATDQIQRRLSANRMGDGDLLRTFEALRDTAHGKPAQTIQGAGGGPLVVSFTQLLEGVDGARTERIPEPAAAGRNGSGHEAL